MSEEEIERGKEKMLKEKNLSLIFISFFLYQMKNVLENFSDRMKLKSEGERVKKSKNREDQE